MISGGLWENDIYIRTVSYVLGFLFTVGAFIFYMQKKNPKWIAAWASVKSWMIIAPILFFAAGLQMPYPYLLLVLACIYSTKAFFRMTGMYHRSWFVWMTYFAIIAQAYLVYEGYDRFFNVTPMVFLCALTLIPIFRNSSSRMIQYCALSLMSFIFFGWGFLHLGRILTWDQGLLLALHIVILSEFNESFLHMGNRLFGKHRPLDNITNRFSIEGYLFSFLLTLVLAWGLRSLLPERSEPYWLVTGLSICILGRLGALTISFIKRDLGVKDTGLFIFGRDDVLSRLDRLMFVAPAVYYGYLYLGGQFSL